MKLYAFILILLFFWSDIFASITINESKDTSKYAIIPSTEVKWIAKQGRLTDLTVMEIENIEPSIKRATDLYNMNLGRRKFPIYSLERYFRQYVAFLDPKGQKVVWINFFCSAEDRGDWHNHIVYTDDGGGCYFTLMVNISTKEVYDIQVNGGG